MSKGAVTLGDLEARGLARLGIACERCSRRGSCGVALTSGCPSRAAPGDRLL
jgi:hypothetical protein